MSLLLQVAKIKKLPSKFLIGLGVRDCPGGLEIPYHLPDGTIAPRRQIRKGLSAKDGFLWTGKGEIIPYGLNRPISENLILVEGSSDCWTLWFYGYCALGLPGATTAKILNAEHLAGVKTIYAWQEPDTGGELFITGLARRLMEIKYTGKVKVITLEKFKDPSEIHIKQGNQFKKIMDYLILTAKPMPIPAPYPTKSIDRFVQMKGDLSDDAILKAKEFPLENLLQVKKKTRILCPNHPDKKPSFYVDNFGYCFSCGYSADSISWLRRAKGLTFREAVIALND